MLNLLIGLVLPKREGTLQLYLTVLGTFKEGLGVLCRTYYIWKVTYNDVTNKRHTTAVNASQQ